MKQEIPVWTPETRAAHADKCRDFYDTSDCVYPNLEVELRLQYIADYHLIKALEITDRLFKAIRSGEDRFTQEEIKRFEQYLCTLGGYVRPAEYILSPKLHYYDMSRKKHRSRVYTALEYGLQGMAAYKLCNHPKMRSYYHKYAYIQLRNTMRRVNDCRETGAKIPGALLMKIRHISAEFIKDAEFFKDQPIPRDFKTDTDYDF